MLAAAGLAAALPLAASGCTDPPAGPSSYAAFSQTDLRVGSGPAVVVGDIVIVHYTGWLYDATAADRKGAQFDSSVGSVPFAFIVGQGQVIAGWDQGLVGMQAGGVRELVIPPSLAYGTSRNRVIPPNATLVFDIELLQIGLEEAQP
jgi:FKBP-type peptidyl-prolyl cis-trans isomerase FkpA